MESALCTLLSALVVLLCSSPECKGEDTVTQAQGDVTATQGLTANIICTFETSNTFPYLFWYKQKVGESPKYMLQKTKTGAAVKSPEFNEARFDAELNGKLFVLKIQDVDVRDSAVYYCALQPTNWRVLFGTGTRLWVHSSEEHEPSFYKLKNDETKLCLGTGFSRANKLKDEKGLFNKTDATFIDRDSDDPDTKGLYSQVALMTDPEKEDEELCPESSGVSQDTLQPDPQVNLMSLTVLGLRVLFIKTVAFNVLMTLRVWMSQ